MRNLQYYAKYSSHLVECGEYSIICRQSDKILLIFSMNMRNIPHKTVSPTKHCYGTE